MIQAHQANRVLVWGLGKGTWSVQQSFLEDAEWICWFPEQRWFSAAVSGRSIGLVMVDGWIGLKVNSYLGT